jgi:hypothetical protein
VVRIKCHANFRPAKKETETNVLAYDGDPSSRWRDSYSGARASLAVFDLLDAENVRARKITGAVDSDDIELAKTLSKTDAPIKIINDLLKLSALPIEISVDKSEEIFASKMGGRDIVSPNCQMANEMHSLSLRTSSLRNPARYL